MQGLLIWGGIASLVISTGLVLLNLEEKQQHLNRIWIQIPINCLCWWLVGWAFMNGEDKVSLIGTSQFVTIGVINYELCFFEFGLSTISLCIFLQSVSSRVEIGSLLTLSLSFSLAVFPIISHWGWSDSGWASPVRSASEHDLLLRCGALDTGGSGIIYMSGGFGAFLMTSIFHRKVMSRSPVAMSKSHRVNKISPNLDVGHAIIALACYFGIAMVINIPIDNSEYVLQMRLCNIAVAVGTGFVFGLLHAYASSQNSNTNRASEVINCMLSAMVSIAASYSTCNLAGAFGIAVIASITYALVSTVLHHLQIDDPHNSISIYFVNGFWGLLAPGFFAAPSAYALSLADSYMDGMSRSSLCAGVMYGGSGYQLAANGCFALAIITWISLTVGLIMIFMRLFSSSWVEPSDILPEGSQQKPMSANRVGNDIHSSSAGQARESKVNKTIANSLGMTDEEFQKSNGYLWDLCIVFPVPPTNLPNSNNRFALFGKTSPLKYTSKQIIDKLHDQNLETSEYLSVQDDELICRVRINLARLKHQADVLGNYFLILDEERARHQASVGYSEITEGHIEKKLIKPFTIYDGFHENITTMRPYQYIYGPYDSDVAVQHLYANHAISSHVQHPFTSTHRIKLIMNIIEKVGDCGCGLNLDVLLADKSILAVYPLHEKEKVDELASKWLAWYILPWNQPFNLVKDYFGEHIGLYFVFLGHYTTCLMPLALIGCAVCAHVVVLVATGQFSSLYTAIKSLYSMPVFCFLISSWTAYMLEQWKRKQTRLALQWGTSSYENTESTRLEYEGRDGFSYIDGSPMKIFSHLEQVKRQTLGWLAISTSIILVIGFFVASFYLKYYLMHVSKNPVLNANGATIGAIVNAIQIPVMASLYSALAYGTASYENPRTDTEYQDSLIAKLFLFNFINSYFPSFYIAFVKQAIHEPCVGNSCMGELSNSLLIIFVSRLVVGNISGFLGPKIALYFKQRSEAAVATVPGQVPRDFTQPEREYMLPEYDKLKGSLEDHNEMSIQFGYLTLFVAACPFAPLVALISNVIEIRADGWKLLTAFRRPVPTCSQDIGTWLAIYELIAIAAVFTNAGLVFYTMELTIALSLRMKMWLVIIFLMGSFMCRQFICHFIADVPREVEIQLQRQDFIVDKLIRRTPDESDDQQ